MRKGEEYPPHKKRNDRIVALYKRGLSCAKIGPRFGMTLHGVWEVLAKRKVPRRTPGEYSRGQRIPRYWDVHKRVAAVAHRYDTGRFTSATQLAESVGVSAAAVRRHLAVMGVHLHSGGWVRTLSPAQVRRIKIDLVKGDRSFREIGERYGVKVGAICAIAMERTWKHIPWPTKAGYVRRTPGARPARSRHVPEVLRGEYKKRKRARRVR